MTDLITANTLKLTPRQHAMLLSDTYANRPEGEEGTTLDKGKVWGGDEGLALRNELRAGKSVTVSKFLLSELNEFADRDDEASEQRVYRNLLKKAEGKGKR